MFEPLFIKFFQAAYFTLLAVAVHIIGTRNRCRYDLAIRADPLARNEEIFAVAEFIRRSNPCYSHRRRIYPLTRIPGIGLQSRIIGIISGLPDCSGERL